MTSVRRVLIVNHTTSSTPLPHVLYVLKVTLDTGKQYEVLRRYSEFITLQKCVRDTYTLPPKNALVHAVIPSAWINDELIAERKASLTAYLNYLTAVPEFQNNVALLSFLTMAPPDPADALDTQCFSSMISKHMVTTGQATSSDDPRSSIAAAYYPTWSAGSNPPNQLDFSKFDIIFFAFVTPNSSSTINWDDDSQEILEQLVSSARKSDAGTKIVLSVGGWGGSYWWSQATSSATNRLKLNNTLVGAVSAFDLDGIDIDWEYPNSTGAGNPHSSADAANLLSFIKILRASLGPSKIISAAVTHLPWLGPSGGPLTDVSAFAAQMTYVNIMNYDVFGASSNPGPNAPLGNPCGTSKQPQANARAALARWTKAGMPASKLLLGVPLYGYVSKSTAKRLSGSLMPPNESQLSCSPPREPFTARAGDLSDMWGHQIAFNQLLQFGVLKKNPDGTYMAINGYTIGWDDCSDTPYLFDVARTTVVSYDDTWSLAKKANFSKQSGMAGCFTWSLDQDDGLTLQNIIRLNLGKK